MRELEVTRAAEADLLEIWADLFEKSEQATDRVTHKITVNYDMLCEFPMMGRRRSEFSEGYR